MEKSPLPKLGEEQGWYATGDPSVPLVPTQPIYAPKYAVISVVWIYYVVAPHPFIDFYPVDKILETAVIPGDPFLRGSDLFFEILEQVIPEAYLKDELFVQMAQSFYEELSYNFFKYMQRILPGHEDEYFFKQWVGRDHVMLERRF